jgi:hypothetical protein
MNSMAGPDPPGTMAAIWFPLSKISVRSTVLTYLVLSSGSGVNSTASSSTRLTCPNSTKDVSIRVGDKAALGNQRCDLVFGIDITLHNLVIDSLTLSTKQAAYSRNRQTLAKSRQSPSCLASGSIFVNQSLCRSIPGAGFALR